MPTAHGRRFAKAHQDGHRVAVKSNGESDLAPLRLSFSDFRYELQELLDFFSGWNLAGPEKGFYQFSFTANDHAGKSLEPFSFRNLRVRVEPITIKVSCLPEMWRC